MSEYKIIRGDDENTFDNKDAFEETVDFLNKQGVEFTTETPDEEETEAKPDGGTKGDPGTPATKAAEPDTPTLREDPIGHLRQINSDYVNTIQGTPAISKRGFRYIQAELEITTETKVVSWSEDPYGVVVWARAELPDGRAAEAHGEGYPSERGMDDGEFVRYADTRAKSRALSDLTSAGALAVDELRGGIDE